jgi:hypothetical protein
MMIMSAVDSTFFTLNETGTAIWQAADGQTRVSQIVEQICSQFEVAEEEAHSDTEQFVTELAEHGILRSSPQPIPDPSPLPVPTA